MQLLVLVVFVVRTVDIALGADVVIVVAVVSVAKVACSSCYPRFQRAGML